MGNSIGTHTGLNRKPYHNIVLLYMYLIFRKSFFSVLVIDLLRTVSKLFIPDQTALLGTCLNQSGIILFAHDFFHSELFGFGIRGNFCQYSFSVLSLVMLNIFVYYTPFKFPIE